MMRVLTTCIFCLVLCCSVIGQDLLAKYPEIQLEKSSINQNDSLSTIVLENEEFLKHTYDGGGQLRGFCDSNDKIRKLEVVIYLSNGVQKYNFYLKDETPFLIEDRFDQFAWNEETGSLDHGRFDGAFRGVYIFREGHLLDQESLGHNRFENDELDVEDTLLSEFESYLQTIKAKL